MRHFVRIALPTLFFITIFTVRLLADFATPFIEINNKAGDVSEGYGHVVDLGEETAPHLLVIVSSDTEQYHVLRAVADRETIPARLISRPAILKVQILEPATPNRQGMVKILGIRPVESGPIQRNRPPGTAPAR